MGENRSHMQRSRDRIGAAILLLLFAAATLPAADAQRGSITVGEAVRVSGPSPLVPGILADHWLAVCRAACTDPTAWQEAHVAGPFDMQRAPYARGFFIGDYMGLAAQGDAFALLYAATTPPGDLQPTAAFFVQLQPKD